MSDRLASTSFERFIASFYQLVVEAQKAPGEFRRVQVRIGGTRESNATFVPPPPNEVLRLMSDLEKFLNDVPKYTTPLLKAGLVHVQFETIHPFLDGNGRVGRLLISLLLAADGLLEEPLLYLSLYFKINRERYYELLQKVRVNGDWESWLTFFLDGVADVASGAADTAQKLLTLFDADKILLEQQGRQTTSLVRVHEILKHAVIISGGEIVRQLHLSLPTAIKSVQKLEELGIVREITGKQRNKLYVYDKYMNILNEGAEPL